MTPRSFSLQQQETAASGAPWARRRERGAAYVEAILIVIFMTIIFVGVQYLGSYFDAKQRALGKARECAWAFSKNACVPEDPRTCGTPGNADCLPPGCAEVLGQDLETDPNTELGTNIKNQQGTAQGLPPGEPEPTSDPKLQKQQDLRAGVDEQMGPMMEMLVGEALNAVATEGIAVPRMVPDAQANISVLYYLPCNLRHREPLEVAMSLFGGLFTGGL